MPGGAGAPTVAVVIPSPEITTRVLREADLVIAYKPWLPRPGVKVGPPGPIPTLYYHWDVEQHQAYIFVPPNWDTDDTALRRIVRHEMGHLWVDALSRRIGNSYDIYPDLQIDGTYPQRHEIAAEIFARVMGEQPSYWDLEPMSRPTPERTAFVERSGVLPDRTVEKSQLASDIGAFWSRSDIPYWFRIYAGNYQRWLDYYVLEPLRIK